jgi:hypothetical protein
MAREHYGIPSIEAHMPVNKYIETSGKSTQDGEEQATSLSTIVYFPIQ